MSLFSFDHSDSPDLSIVNHLWDSTSLINYFVTIIIGLLLIDKLANMGQKGN